MKGKAIDFLFVWEVKVREIDSIILLGLELKRRGYTVEYISFNDINFHPLKCHRLKNRKVNTVVISSMYHNKQIYDYVYRPAGKCRNIVNLRWEQVFSIQEQHKYDSFLFPKDAAKDCTHICWGKAIQDDLIEYGLKKENLPILGPIHFDFIREKYRNFFLPRGILLKQYGMPTDKKIVLFISSFSISSMSDLTIKGRESEPGVEKGYFSEKKKNELVVYEKFLNWLEDFLKYNNDFIFIYRPHPVENGARLNSFKEKYSNFYILSEYNVKQWILCSDYICTWISTSIAEAYFAKKKCAIIRPTVLTDEREMSIYKNANFITSSEEFLNMMTTPEIMENSLNKEILESYYSIDDEKPSFIKIANLLEDTLKSEKSFDWENANLVWEKEEPLFIQIIKRIKSNFLYLLVELRILRKHNWKFWQKINLCIDDYFANRDRRRRNRLSKKEFRQISKKISEVFF